MIARRLQLISALVLVATAALTQAAGLAPGAVARLNFRDVDGVDHSTAADKVLIIAVATRENGAKAEMVADHMPDQYLGNQKYRFITLVNFERKLPSPFRGLTRAIIRGRLQAEAKKLVADYSARKIPHDPRQDVIAVADFDGSEVEKLGLTPESAQFAVFVFNGHGRLVQRWFDVPSEESLGRALAAAARLQ